MEAEQERFLDDFFNSNEGIAKETKINFHFKGRTSYECPTCMGWGNFTFEGHSNYAPKAKSESKCKRCGGLGRI